MPLTALRVVMLSQIVEYFSLRTLCHVDRSGGAPRHVDRSGGATRHVDRVEAQPVMSTGVEALRSSAETPFVMSTGEIGGAKRPDLDAENCEAHREGR